MDLSALQEWLSGHFGRKLHEIKILPCSGGDIHQAFKVETDTQTIFLKLNTIQNQKVLESEFQSLRYVNKLCAAAYFPKPILFECLEQHCVLGMEFMSMQTIDQTNSICCADGLRDFHSIQNATFGG